MLKLIELNYHYHGEFDSPAQVLARHRLSDGYAEPLSGRIDIKMIKHLNYAGEKRSGKIQYHFFKSRNSFWYIPLKSHRFIMNKKPDVILIQGLVFVLQVIALRIMSGKKCCIIAQHHGERPFKGLKGFLQKIADRCIDAYLFSSLENAEKWLTSKTIRSADKCYEVLAASTYFTKQDKQESKNALGITGDYNFLWVGRLDANKDPITVLKGFEQYLHINSRAKLYMIYQTEELLNKVKCLIGRSSILQASVILKGKTAYHELPAWYSACDFYLSGSHRESCGYSLLEAMACGCIPVVPAIPSFKAITSRGKYALLYEPGNSTQLFQMLMQSEHLPRESFSGSVENHFRDKLSFDAIADGLYAVSTALCK